MKLRTLRTLTLASVAALCLGLFAQKAEAVYLFYLRKDLARAIAKKPKAILGKSVVVTDELLVVWPDAEIGSTPATAIGPSASPAIGTAADVAVTAPLEPATAESDAVPDPAPVTDACSEICIMLLPIDSGGCGTSFFTSTPSAPAARRK